MMLFVPGPFTTFSILHDCMTVTLLFKSKIEKQKLKNKTKGNEKNKTKRKEK